MISRRNWMIGGAAALLLSRQRSSWSAELTRNDEDLLDDIERRAMRFFIEQSDPKTGLVADRCKTDGTAPKNGAGIASIAAGGFGLTALCIGHKRGYLPPSEA